MGKPKVEMKVRSKQKWAG